MSLRKIRVNSSTNFKSPQNFFGLAKKRPWLVIFLSKFWAFFFSFGFSLVVLRIRYKMECFFGYWIYAVYLVTFTNQLQTTWKLFWLIEKTPMISHFFEQILGKFFSVLIFSRDLFREGFFVGWKYHKIHFFSQNIDRRGLDLRMVKVDLDRQD